MCIKIQIKVCIFKHESNFNLIYTQKTVSLNKRNSFLIYGRRKNLFKLKKMLSFPKKFL